MTAFDELQIFTQTLDPLCRANNLKFSCLHSEPDLDPTPRLALAPYLYLTQVAEELACGHIISTDRANNIFIRVRTPFAASSTLKFVTLRTFSLIFILHRPLTHPPCTRDLTPAAAPTNPQELLAQATATLTQAQTAGQAFIQPEQSGPLPTKHPGLLAFRSTFCTGVEIASVLPSTPKTTDLTPANLYLL